MDGGPPHPLFNDNISQNEQHLSMENNKADEGPQQRYSRVSMDSNRSSLSSAAQKRPNQSFYTLNISRSSDRHSRFAHRQLGRNFSPAGVLTGAVPVPKPPQRPSEGVPLSTARLMNTAAHISASVVPSGGWRVAPQTTVLSNFNPQTGSSPRPLYSLSPARVLASREGSIFSLTVDGTSNAPPLQEDAHLVQLSAKGTLVSGRRRSTSKPYSLEGGIPFSTHAAGVVDPSSRNGKPIDSPLTSCSISSNSRNTQSGDPASATNSNASPLLRRETIFKNDSGQPIEAPWEKDDVGEAHHQREEIDFLVYNLGSPEKCGSPEYRACSPAIPMQEDIRTPWIGNLRMIHGVIPPDSEQKDGVIRLESVETLPVQQTGSFYEGSPSRASFRGFSSSNAVYIFSNPPHGSMSSESNVLQHPKSSTSKILQGIQKMEDRGVFHGSPNRSDNEGPPQQRVSHSGLSPPSPPPLSTPSIPTTGLPGKSIGSNVEAAEGQGQYVTTRYNMPISRFPDGREIYVEESEAFESGCSTPSMLRPSMPPPPPPPPPHHGMFVSASYNAPAESDSDVVFTSAENVSGIPLTLLSNNPVPSYTQLSPSRSLPLQAVSSMELNPSPRPFAGFAVQKKIEGSPFTTVSHFRIDDSNGHSNVIQTGIIVGEFSPSNEDCPEFVGSPLQKEIAVFRVNSNQSNPTDVNEDPRSPASPHQALTHLVFPTLLPQLSVVYETPCITANNTLSAHPFPTSPPPAPTEVSFSSTPPRSSFAPPPPPPRQNHPSIPNAPPLHNKSSMHHRSNSLPQPSFSGDTTALDTSSHSTFNEALRASQNQCLERGITGPHQQLIVNPNEAALVQMCNSDSLLSSSHNHHLVHVNSDSSGAFGSGSEHASLLRQHAAQRLEKEKEIISTRFSIPVEEQQQGHSHSQSQPHSASSKSLSEERSGSITKNRTGTHSGRRGEEGVKPQTEIGGSESGTGGHDLEITLPLSPSTPAQAPNPVTHQRSESIPLAVTLRERVVSLLISSPRAKQEGNPSPTEDAHDQHLSPKPLLSSASLHSAAGVIVTSPSATASEATAVQLIPAGGSWHPRVSNRDENIRRTSGLEEATKNSSDASSSAPATGRVQNRTSFSFFSTDTVDARNQLTATALRTIKPLFMLPPQPLVTASLRSGRTSSPSLHSSSKVSPRLLSPQSQVKLQAQPLEEKGFENGDKATEDGEVHSEVLTPAGSSPTATTLETNYTLVSTLRSIMSGMITTNNTITAEPPPTGRVSAPVSHYSYMAGSLPSESSLSDIATSTEEKGSPSRAPRVAFQDSGLESIVAVHSPTDGETSWGGTGWRSSHVMASPTGLTSPVASPKLIKPQHRNTNPSNAYSPLHHKVYKVSSEFWNRIEPISVFSPSSKVEGSTKSRGEAEDIVVKEQDCFSPSYGVMSARVAEVLNPDIHADNVNISKDGARPPMDIAAFRSRDRSAQSSSRNSSEALHHQPVSPSHGEGSPLIPQSSGNGGSFALPWSGSPSGSSPVGMKMPPPNAVPAGREEGHSTSFSLQSDVTRNSSNSTQQQYQNPHASGVVTASTPPKHAGKRTPSVDDATPAVEMPHPPSGSDIVVHGSAHQRMVSFNANSRSESLQAAIDSSTSDRTGQNAFRTGTTAGGKSLLEAVGNRSVDVVTPPFPNAVTLVQNRQLEAISLSSPIQAGHMSPLPPSTSRKQLVVSKSTATAIPPPPPPTSRFTPSPPVTQSNSPKGRSFEVLHGEKNVDLPEEPRVKHLSVTSPISQEVLETKERKTSSPSIPFADRDSSHSCQQKVSETRGKPIKKKSKKIKRKKKTSGVSGAEGGAFHLPNYMVRTSSSGRLGKGFAAFGSAGVVQVNSLSKDQSHPLFKRQLSNEEPSVENEVNSDMIHHHHAVQQYPSLVSNKNTRMVTKVHQQVSNVSASPAPSRRPYSNSASIFSSRELNIARLGYRADTPTPTNSIHEELTRASTGNTSSLNCPIVNILQQDSFSLVSQDALVASGGMRTHTQNACTSSVNNLYAAFGAVTRLCSDPDAPRAIRQRRQPQQQQPLASIQQICSSRQVLPDVPLVASRHMPSGATVSDDHPLPLPPSGIFSGTISVKMHSPPSTSSEENSSEDPTVEENSSKEDHASRRGAGRQGNQTDAPTNGEKRSPSSSDQIGHGASSQVLFITSLNDEGLAREGRSEAGAASASLEKAKPTEARARQTGEGKDGKVETARGNPGHDTYERRSSSTEEMWPLQLTLAGRVTSKVGPGVYRPTTIGSFSLVSHQSSAGNNMCSPNRAFYKYCDGSATSSTGDDSSTTSSNFQQIKPMLQRQEPVVRMWRRNMRDKHISRLAGSPKSLCSSFERVDSHSPVTHETNPDGTGKEVGCGQSGSKEDNMVLVDLRENERQQVLARHPAPVELTASSNRRVSTNSETTNINDTTVKAGCVNNKHMDIEDSSSSSNCSGTSSGHVDTEPASLYLQKNSEMDLPTVATVAPLPYEQLDELHSNFNTSSTSKGSTLPNTASGGTETGGVGHGSLVFPRTESNGNSGNTHPSTLKADSWDGESVIPTQPTQYFTAPYL